MAMASARAEAAHCELPSSSADAGRTDPTPAIAATTVTTAPRRAALRMFLNPQIRGKDLLLAELVGLAHELDPALVEDVHEVGQLQRPGHVLLDEQQCGTLGGEPVQVFEDLVDDLAGEAHRALVEKHGLGT